MVSSSCFWARVFLYVPAMKRGKAYKFACPFKGPYRFLALYDNGADIRSVGNPREEPKRVSLNRLQRCPKKITGVAETAGGDTPVEEDPRRTATNDESPNTERDSGEGIVDDTPIAPEDDCDGGQGDQEVHGGGAWKGRLRKRQTKKTDSRGRDP